METKFESVIRTSFNSVDAVRDVSNDNGGEQKKQILGSGCRGKRWSNFELLRIVAMLMIISYHYAVHGYADYIDNVRFSQRVYLEMFSMFGKIGVNLFVLVTGYFGIENNNNIARIIKLECQTLFFSVYPVIILGVLKLYRGTLKNIVKACFPVIFNEYWFITAFVILLLFKPWLNKLLNSLSKKEYKNLLLLMFVIWCVIPCCTLQTGNGMNFTQQIFMFVTYMFGGYIRKYERKCSIAST